MVDEARDLYRSRNWRTGWTFGAVMGALAEDLGLRMEGMPGKPEGMNPADVVLRRLDPKHFVSGVEFDCYLSAIERDGCCPRFAGKDELGTTIVSALLQMATTRSFHGTLSLNGLAGTSDRAVGSTVRTGTFDSLAGARWPRKASAR